MQNKPQSLFIYASDGILNWFLSPLSVSNIHTILSCRPLHLFGQLREQCWSFPPGLQLSCSACHSHTDQKGFCRPLSLSLALYISAIQMLQLRDAHLQDIIAINPKGPEAHGALLCNASEKKSPGHHAIGNTSCSTWRFSGDHPSKLWPNPTHPAREPTR